MTSVALVTGASAGLGRELARLLAADRVALVLVARRRDRLEELAGELRAAGAPTVMVLAEDLADRDAPARIQAAVLESGLEVDILVNNAGFGSNGAFVDLDAARELEMIQVNVNALVDLTQRFLPAMVVRGRGRILNLGSTAGFQPGPYMATYYATKAFVNSFSEALSFELKGTAVTVTLSCPGATATEFGEVAGNARSALFKLGAADATTVAREAYAAMKAGRRRVVHGFTNIAAAQVQQRLGPRAAVLAVVARLNRAKGG
jgi:short-subunit dehydrogenase